MYRMRAIAIANQKGGCGKTTTAVNLAVACVRKGYRVLVVDLDPQAHATLALGHHPEQLPVSIYDTIVNERIALSSIIKSAYVEGLDIAPSNILLSGATTELIIRYAREYVLADKLKTLRDHYDLCIIDCSPSLNILTINALVASEEVIVPVRTSYYALEGLRQLIDSVEAVKERYRCNLNSLKILLTFVEDRTILCRDVQEQIREHFGEIVFDVVIHKCVRLAEAPSAGESVLTYDTGCRGTSEYIALADEVCNHETKTRTPQESVVNI